MKMRNKRAAHLLLVVCLSASCASSLSKTTPASSATTDRREQPAPRQADAGASEDVAQIARLTIDLPALQKFYHADAVPGRKPLLILKNEFTAGEPQLSKFGQPVAFVTCDELKATGKPYLEFTALEVKGDEASAIFRYRVEGIEGRLAFDKDSGAWRVQKQELVEAKFADRGCAPEANGSGEKKGRG